MNRAAPRARVWRSIIVASAGLVFASCGTVTSNAPATLDGVPSISISVPLRLTACTGDNSCVALGTTGTQSVGELRGPNGVWTSLAVPSALSSQLTSSSCWTGGCLIVGALTSGDLVWRYDHSTSTMATARAPGGGKGALAISCFAEEACAVVDSTGVAGTDRLNFTSDAGASWSTPVALAWTAGLSIDSLACSDQLDCLASASAPHTSALLEVTHDAGLTWTVRATPSSWLVVDSLSCAQRTCQALAHGANADVVARSTTFARTWRQWTLAARARALACTVSARCVVVGERTDSGWLATWHRATISPVALRYVPSTLTSSACGTKVCAAVANSTVVSTRP